MEPNPKQALALWRMLTADKPEVAEPTFSAAKALLSAADRTALVKAGYLTTVRRGRATHLVLEKKASDWAAAATSVSLRRPKAPVEAAILEALLNRLLPNLKARGVTLAEILRPTSASGSPPVVFGPAASPETGSPAPAVEPPRKQSAEVLAAVRSLAGRSQTGAVRLAHLRAELSSLARAEVDAALRALRDQGTLVLFQDDDRASLTEADRQAALVDANTPHHLVYLEKR